MLSDTLTIQTYIDAVPADRQDAFGRLRDICKHTLKPLGYTECISYKMLGYVVSKHDYPSGYHCNPELPFPFVNLANQKGGIHLYHMGLYAKPDLLDRFVNERAKHSSEKLDMGKSCIRFKKLDKIPFVLIEDLLGKMSAKEWIEIYEENRKKQK